MIEENMIKDVRNLFRIKMEIDDTAVKGIRNLLRLKKNNGTIKDRVIRDIRNLFWTWKRRLLQTSKSRWFWRNKYIEYESNGDRNKTL